MKIYGLSFHYFLQIDNGIIKSVRNSDFFVLLERAVTLLVPILTSIFSWTGAATLSASSNRLFFSKFSIFW